MIRNLTATAMFVFSVWVISPNSLVLAIQTPQEDQAKASRLLYGVMDAKSRVFRFSVSVDQQNSATLTSYDEGNRKFKLNEFKWDKENLSFTLKATRASYSSKYNAKTKTFEGTWKQSGNDLDLNFTEVDKIPEENPEEIWEGEINAGFQKLILRFKIFDEKAPHRVIMDSVSQRVGGFTGEVKTEDDLTIFQVPVLRGKFSGKYSKDKKTLKGKWNQGVDLALELKRVTPKTAAKTPAPPKRPQTPKAPFPYTVEEVQIRNQSAGLTLSGTLTRPKQEQASPVVILISGSGPQDRDETLLGHKPFWVIADHLSRNGIAVLRFDDRGTGKSTGDHSKATSADFATDVDSIVDFLLNRKDIDASKIGLCGHSEGGLIGPMVAARRKDVAFLVMMAGPGVNGEKILQNQIQLILKAAGEKPENIKQAVFTQKLLLDAVKKSKTELTKADTESLVEKIVKSYPELEKERDKLQPQIAAGIKRLSTPWMKFFLKHEPAPVLEKLKCPVLAINGEKDTQVDPKLNFPAIRSAFETAGKTDFEIVEFPNLNHLFQNCQTGGVGEYETIEETVSPDVLKKLAAWIHQVTKK